MSDLDMEDLASQDLQVREAVLYSAAKAFVAVTEASFIDQAIITATADPPLCLAGVSDGLIDAVHRYSEARARYWAATEQS